MLTRRSSAAARRRVIWKTEKCGKRENIYYIYIIIYNNININFKMPLQSANGEIEMTRCRAAAATRLIVC